MPLGGTRQAFAEAQWPRMVGATAVIAEGCGDAYPPLLYRRALAWLRDMGRRLAGFGESCANLVVFGKASVLEPASARRIQKARGRGREVMAHESASSLYKSATGTRIWPT